MYYIKSDFEDVNLLFSLKGGCSIYNGIPPFP